MPHSPWDSYYPRPRLRRESFLPLNDGWTLDGRPIRAPWPPQAPLSEFDGAVGTRLSYALTFTLPQGFLREGQRAVLHFGAVDQVAEVTLNGRKVMEHAGGYLPFAADVTGALNTAGENRLELLAIDTLSRRYPYGKQHRRPHGMWYTPVSGLWQPVWLEAVPEKGAVRGLRATPDLTGVTLEVRTDSPRFTVTVPLEGGGELRAEGVPGLPLRLDLPDPHLWTPDDPFLYDFTVTTQTETVSSYFALRTVTTRQLGGCTRLCLNDKPVFLHGVLDQGYFHDGLFLPAEPAEYERDILRMKALGFNLLRKHIKVEPEAFYCACDRLGMLVMQDMVNSGGYSYVFDTVLPTLRMKKRFDRLPGDRRRREFFEQHCLDTIRRLYSHPCIIGWTIFNEGWGQYDSDRVCRLCKRSDPTRFFVATSGWFAQKEGDVQSEHVYFTPRVLRAKKPGKLLLLSECGGYTRRIPGHGSAGKKDYGYGAADSEGALTGRIRDLYGTMVLPSIPNGLCGCVYTQLSDVEGEINGLYTYDRQVCKVDQAAMLSLAEDLREAHRRACGGVANA